MSSWIRSHTLAFSTAALLAAASLPAVAATNEVLWQTPTNVGATGIETPGPEIATSPDGQRLAVIWEGDGSPQAIMSATSSDGGDSWSPPQPVSSPGGAYPQLAASQDGMDLTAVWQRWDGTHRRTEAASSSDGGLSWSAPVQLSAPGESADYATVARSADGTAVAAVWQRSDGTYDRVQVTVSADSGSTWSTPIYLSGAGATANAPGVLMSNDGRRIVVSWTRYDGSHDRLQTTRTTDGGATWTTPVVVSADDSDAAASPMLTAGPDASRVAAIWVSSTAGEQVIAAADSTDGALTWRPPQLLSSVGDFWGGPKIAASVDGTRFDAAWAEATGVYTSTYAGGTWSSPRFLPSPGARNPVIASSADGSRLVTVWIAKDGETPRVYAASSGDSGASWGSPQAVSAAEQYASYPALLVTGAGPVAGWRLGGDTSWIQVATGRIPTVPSAPRAVTANATGTQAKLTWQPPANDGGAPVTGYTVTGGGTKCTTKATSCTLTGLTPGSSYQMSVTATNLAGTGPAATASVTMPKATQTATVKLPKRIKSRGKTVLVRKAVLTSAGQKAKAKVVLKPKKAAKVKTTRAGKVTIVTKGRKLQVKLTLRAPATATHNAYLRTKTWKVKRS